MKIQFEKTYLTLALIGFCAAIVLFAYPAHAAKSRYVVRSEAYSEKARAADFAKIVSDRGFHPVIQSDRATDGEFYFLEMGAFDNIDTAMRLLVILRDMKLGGGFMVIDTAAPPGSNAEPPGAALVNPEKTARLFPYQGEPQIDAWSLLQTIPAPAKKDTSLPGVANVGQPQQPAPVPAPQPRISFTRATPKRLKIGITGVPELSNVGVALRDLAWNLRSKGFDAFFEGETYLEPSGILVGIFDTESEGAELASEVKQYGYDTKVKSVFTPEGERWQVYAEIEEQELPAATSLELEKKEGQTRPEGVSPAAASVEMEKLARPKKRIFENK